MRSGRHAWLRTKIVLKDNRGVLSILALWFFFGFSVYAFHYGLSLRDAVLTSLFFKQDSSNFTYTYSIWTQGIIFGVTFGILYQNVLEKYNPERTCRMMAEESSDHIIVIGYSHLGRRIVTHLREQDIPYCLIERDRDAVDDLLRDQQPVIVDDAREMDALADANVASARAVIIASNNLETALLVTKRARELNKDCMIVARCYQDEFAEILESLGANEVISSSKNAFNDIVARI